MVYFLSDAHLDGTREREMRLVHFLDSVKGRAAALYLLGDMFDFWFEYRRVVPRGHVRFLGKLAELADSGVEVHFFTGNHDLWTFDYLRDELGLIVHTEPLTVRLGSKTFFLAHGDEFNVNTRAFRFLRWVFHNRMLQRLFRLVHPDLGMSIAFRWSRHSRSKKDLHADVNAYRGESDPMVCWAKTFAAAHPDVDYILVGHRHILLDLELASSQRFLVLGDWISMFSYAAFNGTSLVLDTLPDATL